MPLRNRARFVLSMVLLLTPGLLAAGERPPKAAAPDDAQAVEMFSAIKDGKIDVQLIPKDSTNCRVLVKNNTDKPLSVKLPDVFAGVQVLAQAPARQPRGNRGNNNAGQGMMGGMGGGMGGMGMGGGGMGMMNIPPERVGEVKVTTVCLDHGKAEPRPKMKYEIRPIEEVTDKPAVAELGRMLGTGTISQRAAQVATWHLNNNMSWEQLTSKQLRFADGTSRPYFTAAEIQAGVQLVAQAQNLAEQRRSSRPTSAQSPHQQ